MSDNMQEQQPHRLREVEDRSPSNSEKTISRSDVIMAFKIILGRPPENEDVITNHQIGSLDELRIVLLKSKEFSDKYMAITKPPVRS